MSGAIKVLFLTYPRIGLNKGGLQIQIEKTSEELKKIGVQVIYYNPWKNEIPDVDLLHLFSVDGTLLWHAERAKQLDKPIVISTVFNAFSHPDWLVSLKVRLSTYVPGMYTDLERAKIILSKSDRILPLNSNEKELLRKAFNIPEYKFEIVPNGISSAFANGDPQLFYDKFGKIDFILHVGSIEKRKNQLNLIKAMANLPYKLFIIGQASQANSDYFNHCKSLAGDNVIFVGQLGHEDPLLSSAFAAAKLFVLPSYSEVMPLTLYEAASAGCGIIISKTVPVETNLSDFISIVDPDSPESIAHAIDSVMGSCVNRQLRQTVLKMPTWTDIAFKIYDIYKNTISLKL